VRRCARLQFTVYSHSTLLVFDPHLRGRHRSPIKHHELHVIASN
jgi:hypothetical protein